MREFRVYAPAKLNLYLDVLDKRPDGYHNIKTLYEKIDLKDEIIVREIQKGLDVKIESCGFPCPSGKRNIVYKALQAIFKIANVDLGLEVIIRKRIPVSAGLGGGSSDAASILRSINKEFNLGVSYESLFSIAASIGKDVPFFMLDTAFAIATGAGELLKQVYTQNSFSHIVIKPRVSISTQDMYKRLDEQGYRSKGHCIEEIAAALKKNDLALLEKSYYNVFESVLADYNCHIKKAKALLVKAGSGHGFLSGSGPSVFCTLKNREEAMNLLKRLPKEHGMDIFLTTTYKGGIYGDN